MASESLLVTADHKRIGKAQIVVSLLLLAVAGTAGIIIRTQAAGGTIDHFDAMTSLHDALVGVFVVLPLWFGIATVVVPLQLGTNKLAFPKAAAASLWSLVGGAALVVIGYTESPAQAAGRSIFRAVPLPGSLAEQVSTKSADLIVLGMLLGALATAVMAVNLVTTILSRRAHGLTVTRLPYFSWSVLVGGIAVAVSSAAFISGLGLVWIDQHFNGSFFTSGAANVFWTHAVWLGGRPEAILASVFVLGAGSDIISTATGKANELDKVTRAAIAGFATLSFVVWTGGAADAGGILAPFTSPAMLIPVAAAGVVVLTWLAQLRHGVKAVPALVPLVLTLGTAAVAVLNGLLAVINDPRGGTWSQTSVTLVAVFIPLAGAIAALIHWAPKLVGGAFPAPIAGLASLAALGGAALYTLSGALLGADNAPDYAATWDKADGHGGLALLGAAGIGLAAAAVVLVALGYAGARSKSGVANTYGSGATLEWAAASPPPAHNFDSVPDVTSPTPLVVTGGSAS